VCNTETLLNARGACAYVCVCVLQQSSHYSVPTKKTPWQPFSREKKTEENSAHALNSPSFSRWRHQPVRGECQGRVIQGRVRLFFGFWHEYAHRAQAHTPKKKKKWHIYVLFEPRRTATFNSVSCRWGVVCHVIWSDYLKRRKAKTIYQLKQNREGK
jgi:hypothetical protein